MKMLVFYRSREYTNAIISSTKAKLAQNDKARGLDVEFINLDKRNYIKVLDQMEELPRFVYIWYDEEKVTDYIKETYPSIEVLHFNVENAVQKNYDSWYGYSTKEYKLVDLMLEKFKDSLQKRTMYQVDSAYKITKSEMDDMDVASLRYPSFETRDIAKQYCILAMNVLLVVVGQGYKELKEQKQEVCIRLNYVNIWWMFVKVIYVYKEID